MLNLSYEQIISTILENTTITKEELQDRINAKLKELSNLISKEGAAHIIANELNVKLLDVPKVLKIKDVLPGMRLINMTGKVINFYGVREFNKDGRKARLATMLIGDETATTRLVIWDEVIINEILKENLKENDIIKLRGASCRENQGYKELHLASKAQLSINPEGETISNVLVKPTLIRKKISELQENDYAEVLGTIVQMFEPRFFEVCPLCGARVRIEDGVFACKEHSIVEPKLIPFVNFFFDDGSANIRVVAFRNQAELILERNETELVEMKNNLEKFEELKSSVLGKQFLLKGKVNRNEMMNRLEFAANEAESVDYTKLAEVLLK
ncbi:MAG: DUF2240 family protein [Candidatus Nanoarchaeia archaeon]|nr:DUF2240 family protein [Candidatus Nanoarchaeia archaeon]